MPARRIQTLWRKLQKEQGHGRPHREHRSRKTRNPDYKRKRREAKVEASINSPAKERKRLRRNKLLDNLDDEL